MRAFPARRCSSSIARASAGTPAGISHLTGDDGVSDMTDSRAQAFREEVGHRLRNRRVSLGLSQEEVAWAAGVAQGSISHYEQGKTEIPLGVLIEICRRFGISPIDIVPSLGAVSADRGSTARAS